MCGFWMQNSDFWTGITSLYESQTYPVVLCMQNGGISTWMTSLCVLALICDFCVQNSAFWTRISSLYGCQTSSMVFACKTAHLGPEFQVSMGPRLHLWFWAHITACLAQEWTDCICSIPHLWFCACKAAALRLELQVFVGPRPHLWFLLAKQRLLDQNNESLWVPDMTCRFVHEKHCD